MEGPCAPRTWNVDHWLACSADVVTAAGELIGAVHNGGPSLSQLRAHAVDWHECHWLALLTQLAAEYHSYGLTVFDVRERLLDHEIARVLG